MADPLADDGDEVNPRVRRGRVRKGLPAKPSEREVEYYRHTTRQAYIPRKGVIPAQDFAEMVDLLFGSTRAFCEYTGLSVPQVQRYRTARSPVPLPVAVLLAGIAAQQRHGIPLAAIEDVGGRWPIPEPGEVYVQR